MVRGPLVPILAFVMLAAAVAAEPSTSPTDWLDHAEHDLGRFWLDVRYHGDPPGDFPTFICGDGRVWDAADPCPSLAEAPDWIASELGRQYFRMVSRQTYTYGVIFHLTGEVEALELARAGARYLVDTAFDPATGSVATYLEGGEARPEPAARTTQSLAYALIGPSFLYYLTGDPALLPLIHAVKDHIFADYWSTELAELRWANATEGDDTRDRRELVAQLDQVNAYMLLMLPLLSGDERQEWEGDLRRLVAAMLRDYHDAENWRFYGYLHDASGRVWGERHNDFGHTCKAYWMLERAGLLLDEPGWVATARTGLADVLTDALVRRHLREAPRWQRSALVGAAAADSTYWIWSNRPDGTGIAWWEWCELDQAAATMALADPRWVETLERVLPTWFAAMIDPQTGAVYPFPGATRGARAHHWQNGYHAAEHALVGYITSSILADQPYRLHFAPVTAAHPLRPYYFSSQQTEGRPLGAAADGSEVLEVWFRR